MADADPGAKVLVVGSGAREHALVEALAASEEVYKVFAWPGNPGMDHAKVYFVNVSKIKSEDDLPDWCKRNGVKLVVIGPEAPLVNGLADKLRAEEVAVFGPSRKACLLYTSPSPRDA